MLNDSDLKVIADVEQHGFHSVGVFEDDEGPGFQYSVGFGETLGSPEVIVFGLKRDVMHNMLWSMFRQIKDGAKLSEGSKWSDLIEGHDCIARAVHPSQFSEYLGYCLWYDRHCRRAPLGNGVYQLFWPGRAQGLFPWERGCMNEVSERQPPLYLPRETGLA